mmetsp:Transcript_56787/g.113827  ORF Transcript_56787/g.113827 Transcript_56787/m.113827 type:complete len:299 (-) Transcript_56787:1688-2584(-)
MPHRHRYRLRLLGRRFCRVLNHQMLALLLEGLAQSRHRRRLLRLRLHGLFLERRPHPLLCKRLKAHRLRVSSPGGQGVACGASGQPLKPAVDARRGPLFGVGVFQGERVGFQAQHVFLRVAGRQSGALKFRSEASDGFRRRRAVALHRLRELSHGVGGPLVGKFGGGSRARELFLGRFQLVHEPSVHGPQRLEGGLVQPQLVAGLGKQGAGGFKLPPPLPRLGRQLHVGVLQVCFGRVPRHPLTGPSPFRAVPFRAARLLQLPQRARGLVQSGLELVFQRHFRGELAAQVRSLVVQPP